MWPFRRRQTDLGALVKAFADKGPLTTEMVDAATDQSLPRLDQDVGHIVVVMLRDNELPKLPGLFTKVFDIAHRHDALVEGVMSSLALLTLDFSDKTTAEARRHELVADLRAALAIDAKIIHGTTERLHGLVGSSRRSCYGSFLPDFAANLRRLDRANFGDVIGFS